jgi:hypothetical protein
MIWTSVYKRMNCDVSFFRWDFKWSYFLTGKKCLEKCDKYGFQKLRTATQNKEFDSVSMFFVCFFTKWHKTLLGLFLYRFEIFWETRGHWILIYLIFLKFIGTLTYRFVGFWEIVAINTIVWCYFETILTVEEFL